MQSLLNDSLRNITGGSNLNNPFKDLTEPWINRPK